MEPSDRPAGRHRAPDGSAAPARPTGGAHRAAAPVPEPAPAPIAGPTAAEERAADLARFLAAARERPATAPAAAARDRPGRAPRRWPRRAGVLAVVAVAVVGLGAAVRGLDEGGRSSPTPALAGPGTVPSASATPVPGTPTPSTVTPSGTPTPTTTPTPTPTPTPTRATVPDSTAVGPPASSPPVKVKEVPVVPVPATANGAAWQRVVTQLFTARSAAFATGRPALLTTADAPGSPLLKADRQLYAAAIARAGFSRAAGLGFDLDQVRLIASGPTTARLAVAGRERTYVLQGPAGQRVVPAGPHRELTLRLTRSSTTARWLLAAGSSRAGS